MTTANNGTRTLTLPMSTSNAPIDDDDIVTLRSKTIQDSICRVARDIGATFLARGEYGMTFAARGSDVADRIEYLIAHASSDPFQHASIPRGVSDKIVLKFGFAVRGDQWSTFTHNFRREVALQYRAQQKLDAGDVPEVYCGGTFPSSGYSLIVMKLVSGPHVSSLWNAKSVSPRLQQDIRRVVYSLWRRAGIAHADLHMNQLVQRTKERIAILDFGQSVLLPRHIVSQLPDIRRPSAEVMVELWKRAIEPYVDAALTKRGVKMYLPNGTFIASVSRQTKFRRFNT